jgi:hypothetical protein
MLSEFEFLLQTKTEDIMNASLTCLGRNRKEVSKGLEVTCNNSNNTEVIVNVLIM